MKNKSILITFILFFLWPFFVFSAETINFDTAQPECFGSSAQAILSWTSDLPQGNSFSIFRKSQDSLVFVELEATPNLSYTDVSAESGESYTYQIRSGEIYSEEKSVSPIFCAPALEISSSCQDSGPEISLSWNQAEGDVLRYDIYKNGQKITEVEETSFSDGPNLEAALTYSYQIKAIWDQGLASSNQESAPAPACAPILNVSSSCLSASPGGPSVSLAWTSLFGVQQYQIYRKNPSASEYILLGSTSLNSYTDNLSLSLENYWQEGSQASYFVRAVWAGAAENSSPSDLLIPRCQPFLSIQNNCDEFSFRLSWTKTQGASNYNIYRNSQFIYQASSESYTDYMDLDLCPGQACLYSYQVEAVGSNFSNLFSNQTSESIDCATIAPPSPPPFLEEPETYCVNGMSNIRNEWSFSDNVTYYSIFRNGSALSNLLETSYIDSSVQNGYEYTYYVIAYGSGGASVFSDNARTIVAADCDDPSDSVLTLSQGCASGLSYVDLSWSESSNTLSYEIHRGSSSENMALLAAFQQGSPEFSSREWRDSNVSTSTLYYYKVISRGPSGTVPGNSDPQSISTLSCLPTLPILSLSSACINQNPAVNLSWITDGNYTLKYEIFREDYSLTIPIHTITDPAIKNWQDQTINPSQTYRYKVDAVGYFGSQRSSSGYNQIASYNCVLPGSYSLSEPALYCQGPYPYADLSWTQSAGAISYNILRNNLIIKNQVVSPFTEESYGRSLQFDGYYDYVDIPNDDSLNPQRITLEAWIYPTEFYYYGNILSKRNPDQYILRFENNTGKVQGYIYSGGLRSCTTTNLAELNKWNHIAMTYDGSYLRIYVNGVQGCSRSYVGNISSGTSPLRIGSRYATTNYNERFEGAMDEPRIYNRALSALEISEHYQRTYNNESGLVGFWRFDEGSGQSVSDSSNGGNDGYLGSSLSVEAYDPIWINNGIQSGINYSWQVNAINNGGNLLSNMVNSQAPICPPASPGLYAEPFCQDGTPSAEITWSYTMNTERYEIYDSVRGLIKTINQQDPEFYSRIWNDNGLSQQTEYNYHIKAIGPAGESQSQLASAETPLCVAPDASILTGSFVCSGTGNSYPRIDLSWTVPENTLYFTLYRSPSVSPFPITTEFSSYQDNAVIVNSSYTYYVSSYGAGGSSSPSVPVVFLTGYCSPSLPAVYVYAGCDSVFPKNTIGWTDSTPLNTLKYEIYKDSAMVKTVDIGDPEFSSRIWNDSEILPLSSHSYFVKTIGQNGNQLDSSEESTVAYSCGLAPSSPVLSSELFCQNNIPYAGLSWTEPENAHSYNIYRTNPDSSVSVYSAERSIFYDRGSFSLQFDGIDDYLSVPNASSLQIIGNLTVSFWAYPANISKGRQNPLGKAYGGEFNFTMETNGRLTYYHGSAKNNTSPYMSCSASNIFSNNTWVHVMAVRNISDKTVKIYKNGVLATTCSYTIDPSASSRPLTIGYEYAGYWQGLLDEIRIYNRILSNQELQNLYSGFSENDYGLAVDLHLNEGSGSAAYDKSGYGNNAAINGSVWVDSAFSANRILPLVNLGNYGYKVKAFGADAESGFSNEILITGFSCLPAKPDLQITSGCAQESSFLMLSWQADSNTSYWSIYRRRAGDTSFLHLADTASSYYEDYNIENGVNYEYFIEAVGVGENAFSDSVSETSQLCQDIPYDGQVFNITVASVCYGYSSRIEISWPQDLSGNTIFYDIWRKNLTSGETEFSELYAGFSSITGQYADFNIVEGSSYVYKIKAVGSMGYVFSSESSQIDSQNCSTVPPNPPQLYFEGVKSTGDGRFVWIYWTDAGNEETYEIWRASSPFSQVDQLPGIEIPRNISWIDSSGDRILLDEETYQYKIVAENPYGRTESNIIAINIPIATPGNFSLSGEKVNDALFYLSWTESSTTPAGGPVTYEVFKDEDPNFSSPEVICIIECQQLVCEQALECSDTNPTLHQANYRVRSSNRGGYNFSSIISQMFIVPIWREIAPW
ncbi:MAG: hypothetical protein A2365_03795 [Candidatus Nealsonbacteria bacterium RIFOXYB1_FULL_40_15]|uniref:Uncharacterized protein n=2 Tax=Candidatus Nealsoniibacteriota TaxID=1817911 RepID=A0A1G2EM12_9BACT|nr:MAG: hypothetical protein A2427_00935 [Candidatus Nealsonbacteria bacterium RIFOXYC1_FULL_40_7]OGZ27737.1 MAG: hypothetical protein A2365_03795 [Candidatus Nealsonbacteria bacterium RIFOXYB1_FULL_40_15]OGZ29548.1 MAG: hypothetical protein A2562_02565 [Candidatus Nealsonbacteria bacterium RIFOXYD1_FULL_39_11]